MTCRATTSATTCAGTPTGAQLSYDNEGRLSACQNAPCAPTTTDQFLYDGAGQRVEQQATSGGATTTTVYVGQVEELSTTGTTTTTTTYYYAGGKRLALAVNGSFYYLGSDGVGSASVALDSTGNVQASTLYGPYGTTRYSSGTMPGSYGYTGQHADATTGLDYYNARYYDANAGQFASADTARDELNRYGYVHGNPTTANDPSGHWSTSRCFVGDGCFTTHGKDPVTPPPPPGPRQPKPANGNSQMDALQVTQSTGGSIVGKCYDDVCIGGTMMALPCLQALCLVGNEPGGSFSLSGALDNATKIILHGTSMLGWLINKLMRDSDSVWATGTGELNSGATQDGFIAAAAFALMATPCSFFCAGLGLIFTATAITQVANAKQWGDNLRHVTNILESVERDIAVGAISQQAADQLTIEVAEHDGALGGWSDQSFTLAMYVPAGLA